MAETLTPEREQGKMTRKLSKTAKNITSLFTLGLPHIRDWQEGMRKKAENEGRMSESLTYTFLPAVAAVQLTGAAYIYSTLAIYAFS